MKYLFLGNTASISASMIRAIQALGHKAHAITPHVLIQNCDNMEQMETDHARRAQQVKAALDQCDVAIWHSKPLLRSRADLDYAVKRNIPRAVWFHGTDIRLSQLISDKYYTVPSKYREFTTRRTSVTLQQTFLERGFRAITSCPEMRPYLLRQWGARHLEVTRPCYLPDFAVSPTASERNATERNANELPFLVHSASRPELKGTVVVEQVFQALQREYGAEIHIITGQGHSEAMAMVQRCDVFVDQFVMGIYGVAAVEAMAYGKPVVGYIRPDVEFPPDLPIIHATPDALYDVLRETILDSESRAQQGAASRQYVERHHDAIHIASRIMEFMEAS